LSSNPVTDTQLRATIRKDDSCCHKATNNLQRALVIVAIVCAVISLIPSVGWSASLSLRFTSCLIISTQCILSYKKGDNKQLLLLHIVRLAFTALGLVGVAANINSLIIISLSMDLALQTIQLCVRIYKRDPAKSLTHMNFILIDSLAIAGIVTGTWPLIAAAVIINAVTMLAFGAQALTKGAIDRDPHSCWESLSL